MVQLVAVNGCVIVLVGHCTRNDCALAATAAKVMITMEIQTWYDFLIGCSLLTLTANSGGKPDSGCRSGFRG